MRTTFPALALGLLFAGCASTATQPPDPSPTNGGGGHTGTDPTGSGTATGPAPTVTATSTDTPTISPPGSGGQTCGSRGLPPCPDDQFCDFPKGSQCGATDAGGVCKTKPQACTRELNQMCGCDGKTYPNPCVAHAAGVSIAKEGKCE